MRGAVTARFPQRSSTMTSPTNACAVLHCDSQTSHGVEFFDFPQFSDPRYSTWIERTGRGSQWAPSKDSQICYKHFRSADILTIKVAGRTGRTEKRLKCGAVPCVYNGLLDSAPPQASVSRPDSPEIEFPATPMSTQQRKNPAPRSESPEIFAPEPKRKRIEPVILPSVNVSSESIPEPVLPNPDTLLSEDAGVCCVPGCLSRRDQDASKSLRFHAFPTNPRMEWEWTKRVRCSNSWKPAPDSVVCSAHFSSPDYDMISGTLSLKPTAIPRQLSCMAQFMTRGSDKPDTSSRWCAICGYWRTIDQNQYKAAARLGFCQFPTDSAQREKWLAVCTSAVDGTELHACENHFFVKDVVSRFAENGEEKFTVRDGVVPCRELSLWSDLHFSEAEDEARMVSENGAIVAHSTTGNEGGAAETHCAGVRDIQPITSGTASTAGLFIIRRGDARLPNTLSQPSPAIRITVPQFLLETNQPIVCCVPGCPVTSLNTGISHATLFQFISQSNPRYATWVGRIRCAVTWIPTQPLAICSKHFEPSDMMYREPQTKALLPRPALVSTAVPSRLTCIEEFHFSGLRNGETDVTGMLTCVVCHAKRKPDACKPAEKLHFFLFPTKSNGRSCWMKFVGNQPGSGAVTDTSVICENHFRLPLFTKSTNGDVILKFLGIPSCTFCLQPEFPKRPSPKPPMSTFPKTSMIMNSQVLGTNGQGPRCCVPGCGNDRGAKGVRTVRFFRFVKPEDPRYQLWLERLRPYTTWTPNELTKVCSDHFLPSQITVQKDSRRSTTTTYFFVSRNALPSLLNGITKWEPAELPLTARNEVDGNGLKTLTFDCCMAGCGNMKGCTVSKEVKFFQFVCSADRRYDTWLNRASGSEAWIPDGSTKICSEHFLPSHIKYRTKGDRDMRAILCRTALPCRLNGEIKWEPTEMPWKTTTTKAGDLTEREKRGPETPVENEAGKTALKKFGWECSVPGCGNVKGIYGSKSVVFFKFVTSANPRYDTWMRRLRYNAAWTPDSDTRICSDHFLCSEIRIPKNRYKSILSTTALPSQLSCMAALSRDTPTDATPEQITCAACGLVPLVVERDLKSSEKLQFFPAPVNEEARKKWIEFCRTLGNHEALLSGSAAWFLCENHFHPDDYEHPSDGTLRRLRMDAVPSVKFSLEPDYIDPMLQSNGTYKPVSQRRLPKRSSTRLTGSSHICVVPGCVMSAYNDGSAKNVSFHIFPSKLGGRFNEWVRRIRCAVSWDPKVNDRICSLHFLPEDFVSETCKGKQRKTRCLGSTAVPTKLDCLEKFRTSRSLDMAINGGEQACCICSCWRPVVKSGKVQRSERLAFFPFPTADVDRRDQWMQICRNYRPDFVLSAESLVCENHFHREDLISVYDDEKKATRVVLHSSTVPSKTNLPWLRMALNENGSGNISRDNSDIDDAYMDVDELDVNGEWENETSVPLLSISRPVISNGLPDDVDGEFSHSMFALPDFSSELPGSAEDDPKMYSLTKSPPPVFPENNAQIFCAQCQAFLRTPCWLHASSIPDEPVIPYSVASLPNVLYMDVCDDSPTGKAVFAKELLPRHMVFGPLVAPLSVDKDANTRFWSVDIQQKHYHLDSEHACNWMKHVRFADSLEDSNMLAFARGAEVVFATARTIMPHEELKVSYSAQYREIVDDAKNGAAGLCVKTESMVTVPYAKDATASFLPETETIATVSESGSFGNDDLWNDSVSVDGFGRGAEVVFATSRTITPHEELEVSYSEQYMEMVNDAKKGSVDLCVKPETMVILPCATPRFLPETETTVDESGSFDYDDQPNEPVSMETLEEDQGIMDDLSDPEICISLAPAEPGPPLPEISDADFRSITEVNQPKKPRPPAWRNNPSAYLNRNICVQCNMRFRRADMLELHELGHDDSLESSKLPERQCPECQKEFGTFHDLLQHVDQHGTKLVNCPVCNQSCTASTVTIHTRKYHPEYKGRVVIHHLSTCPDCGMRLPSDFLFRLHRYKHGDKKCAESVRFPHTCSECGKVFQDLTALVEHVDEHAKRYQKCPVCDQWFAALKLHMRHSHPGFPIQPSPASGSKALYENVTCNECGLRFPVELLCKIHMSKHGDRKLVETMEFPHKCDECSQPFGNINSLVDHVDVHGKQLRKCPVCDRWFSNLNDHLYREHRHYRISACGVHFSATCTECGLRFPTDSLCRIHEAKHKIDEPGDSVQLPRQCPQCPAVFDELGKLITHVDGYGRQTRKCPVCFKWFGGLNSHINNHHPEYTRTCDDCGLRFPTDELFVLHKHQHGTNDSVHAQDVPLSCPECRKWFEKLDELLGHVNDHGQQVEKCPVCFKWFGALKYHIRNHHPEYTLTCGDCGLRFPTDELFELHKHQHEKSESTRQQDIPRSCPECGKWFKELNGLLGHVNDHGQQVERCPVCQQWFMHMRSHVRYSHPNYVFPSKSFGKRNLRSSTYRALTCEECGIRFPTDDLYQLHKNRHESNDNTENKQIPLKCPQCFETFEDHDNLIRHADDHGQQLEKCSVCEQWCAHLSSHLRRNHPDGQSLPHVESAGCIEEDRPVRRSVPNVVHSLTCQDCGLRFSTVLLRQIHELRHGKDELTKSMQLPLQCPECPEVFEEWDKVAKHVDQHGKQMDKCPHCDRWFGSLKEHLRRDHPENRAPVDISAKRRGLCHALTCRECGLRFSTESVLQFHKIKHDNNNYGESMQLPQKCPECTETFAEHDELFRHIDGHGKQLEKCPLCVLWFISVKKHVRRCHPAHIKNRGPGSMSAKSKDVYHALTCRECGLRFATKSVLQFHEIKHGKNNYGENVQLNCPECAVTFEELGELIEHIDGHGKQLLKCPVCGLWFSALKEHVRRDHPDHQENRPPVDLSARGKDAYHSLTCHECGLRFSTKSILEFHETKHGGDNYDENMQLPQKCPVCAEIFEELGELFKHIDGHGKQLQKCPVCGLWFSALKEHVRRDHPDHEENRAPVDSSRTDLSARRNDAYHSLTCRECGLRFSSKAVLQFHDLKHGSNCGENVQLPQKCPDCAETFEELDKLIDHIDGHGKQLAKCPVCGLWFSALNEHLRRDHPAHFLMNPPAGKSHRSTYHAIHNSTCDDCGLRFRTDVCLKLHQRKHRDDSVPTEAFPQKCPECDQIFDDIDGLVGHIDKHGQALEQCPVCVKWYADLKYHLRHKHSKYQRGLDRIRSAAKPSGVACQECGLRFSSNFLCQIHEFKHGTNKSAEHVQFPMECPECSEMFQELERLVKHVDQHGSQSEKCQVCNRWFGSLEDHMRRNHPENQLSAAERTAKRKEHCRDLYHFLTCSECGLRFKTKVLLELHSTKHGNGDNSRASVQLPQECPECADTFDASDDFIEHVDQHGKQLDKCSVCGLWFGALRCHMRRDHREHFDVQYSEARGSIHHMRACTECGLRFPSVECCNLHKCKHGKDEFTESMVFPQKCPECGEVFGALDGLADHVDEHGHSMDRCPVCGKWYLDLKRHLRSNHPESKGQLVPQSDQDCPGRKFLSHYLTCQDCGLRFGKNFLCQIHEHKHGSHKFAENLLFPVGCPECGETFHDLDGLVKHVDQHGMQLEKCPFCSRWFGMLDEHMRRQHKEHLPLEQPVKVCATNTIGNMLTCNGCGLRFPSASLCRLHKYKHDGGDSMEFPRKCPECEVVFEELDGLVDHVDEHGQGLDRCPVCDNWCIHLEKHIRRCHPKSKAVLQSELNANSGKRFLYHYLTCGECGLRFPTHFLCQVHESQHGKSSLAESLHFPRNCPECIQTFDELGKLVEHVVEHGKQLEKCPVCGRWFGALSEHLVRYHPDHHDLVDLELSGNDSAKKQSFFRVTCSDCGLRFATDFLCKLHRYKHGSTAYAESLRLPRKCPECREEFVEINAFVEHIERHGRQLEQCPVCNRWFGAVKEHVRREHPEYRPVKRSNPAKKSSYHSSNGYHICSECGLRFTSEDLCKTHLSNHGGIHSRDSVILPQKCVECDRMFKRLEEFVEHVDEHGQQTEKCPVCRRWFGKLAKHLRHKHPQYRSSSVRLPKKRSLMNVASQGKNGCQYVTCNECGLRFATDLMCKLHGYNKHSTNKFPENVKFPQQCAECDKIFTELDGLVEHAEEHGKVTKKCPVCNRWFSDLSAHLRSVHPDYEQSSLKKNGFHYLTCNTCGLRFPTEFLRMIHDVKHGSTGGVENLTFPQKCPECDETLGNRDELVEHVDKHGKQTEQCPVCGRWFDQMRKHTRRGHPEYRRLRAVTTGFTCNDCGLRFPTDIVFGLHQVKHGKEYNDMEFPQQCPECDETFEQLEALVDHVDEHGRDLVKCPICARWFTELRYHMRRSHPGADRVKAPQPIYSSSDAGDTWSGRNQTCKECGLRFANWFVFRLHNYKHGNDKDWENIQFPQKCPGCPQVFEGLDELTEHVDTHGEELWRCPVCNQWFKELVGHVRERHRAYYARITSEPNVKNCKETAESSLCHQIPANGSELTGQVEQDESSHTEIGSPNTCLICHRHYANLDELNKHTKEHKGNNGFTCNVCSEHFPAYRLLSRHVADDHRPANPATRYACTICESAFSQPADLEFHLFTHDTELQFKCDAVHCGKRFVSAKSLQGHVANVHGSRKRKRR